MIEYDRQNWPKSVFLLSRHGHSPASGNAFRILAMTAYAVVDYRRYCLQVADRIRPG